MWPLRWDSFYIEGLDRNETLTEQRMNELVTVDKKSKKGLIFAGRL